MNTDFNEIPVIYYCKGYTISTRLQVVEMIRKQEESILVLHAIHFIAIYNYDR